VLTIRKTFKSKNICSVLKTKESLFQVFVATAVEHPANQTSARMKQLKQTTEQFSGK